MSWIAKAENLLNKIDQSAAVVLQQKDETQPLVAEEIIQPRNHKNIMVLSTQKRSPNSDSNDRWDVMSEQSSTSSKNYTVIDKTENGQSDTSLNSFSIEKELASTKVLASELKSENHELKCELAAIMEEAKVSGNSLKIQELERLCSTLQEEKEKLIAKYDKNNYDG